MALRLVTQAKRLAGKVVLVRLDTNVPLAGKKVVDDTRLREAVPTLRFLEKKGARLILLGHRGRPAGKVVPGLTLKPVGYALGKILRQPVKVMPLTAGAKALRQAAGQAIVLLENIRFERGEDTNSPALARELGKLGYLYVNEALPVSHRAAASLVGVTRHLPSYAGLALAHEVSALDRVRSSGAKPVVAVVGGAKVADKLPVIERMLPRLTAVLVGGAVANTFLAAKGISVGTSVIDRATLTAARRILRRAGKKLVLPVDVVVARAGRRGATWRPANGVGKRERIIDLGTATCQLFAQHLRAAQTILWAGVLGIVEQAEGRHASLALGHLVAARARGRAYVVVGGGDSAAFFRQHHLWADHMSTAGSAMLQFLAGEKLPALAALGYR